MRTTAIRLVGILVFFGALISVSALVAQTDPNGTIGAGAEQTYNQYYADGPTGTDNREAQIYQLITYAISIGGIVLLLLLVATGHLSRLTNYRPFAAFKSNLYNSRLFLVFLIVGFVLLIWENNLFGKYVLIGDSASAHGQGLDSIMITTLIITFIAFVITQALLFVFSYMYYGKEGRVASYYHDNNKLELAWTLVPATVMAVLVLFGFRQWATITKVPEPGSTLEVEVVAEQFQWNVHYAGKDNQLAGSDYRLIGSNGGLNSLGLKFDEAASHDDIIGGVDDDGAKVLYLPKGRPVNINIRSKDVLHGVFMPHFRVQMYAVPGMPTHFTFTPTVTTAEKRNQTGNPNFNYEMACSQLCGSAHYNMRVVINVVEEAEFVKWLEEQPVAYDAIKAAETPTETKQPTAAAEPIAAAQ